jgi:hypothetical protein
VKVCFVCFGFQVMCATRVVKFAIAASLKKKKKKTKRLRKFMKLNAAWRRVVCCRCMMSCTLSMLSTRVHDRGANTPIRCAGKTVVGMTHWRVRILALDGIEIRAFLSLLRLVGLYGVTLLGFTFTCATVPFGIIVTSILEPATTLTAPCHKIPHNVINRQSIVGIL